MTMEFFSSSAKNIALVIWFLLSSSLFLLSNAQQQYINNKQLDCDNNKNVNYTNGFVCNGPQTTCTSYLTFRSQPPYVSASTIGYLMTSEPSAIAKINNITDVETIPTDTQIIVPVNCSCSGGFFYQHNASYGIKTTGETYFSVANNTYQGLSTCQALINQNPYGIRDLVKDLKLLVPLRCACASAKQSANGVRFLLVYLVTWGDTVGEIGNRFGVDEKSINDANELSETGRIYPFTSLLIPLKSEPKKISSPPPPPPPSPPPPPPAEPEGNSNKKWVFIGIGIGAGLFVLVLISVILWFILRRRRDRGHLIPVSDSAEYTKVPAVARAKNSEDVSSQGVRNLVDSLTMYKYEELEKATENFGEDQRIKGSVYRGMIRGDYAAIKRTRINDPGDDSSETEREINILKQINHSSIIRLSGYCTQEDEGNTYLVYEYAENGSLSDWLHDKKPENRLGWKQRVQIAYDVADGLNYLHNYTNPAYVHKDLKSSNILLNGDFRAKMTNFGLARTVENDSEDEDGGSDGGLHLTRHVVGTRGYMPPEYIENGVVTPKLDVFAFGVVMLELISGKEASAVSGQGGDVSLSLSIKEVLEGENVREKLKAFIDPSLEGSYPLDSAFSVADLAMKCVAHDINSRPTMSDVFMSLSKILSSCLDWDPSDELEVSRSFSHGN